MILNLREKKDMIYIHVHIRDKTNTQNSVLKM